MRTALSVDFGSRCALLVFTALVSIWLGFKVNAVRRQQAVVAELTKLKISVFYDHQHYAQQSQQPATLVSVMGSLAIQNQRAAALKAPSWLRRLIGDKYFQTVTAVSLSTNELSEVKALMPLLKKLPELEEVFLPISIHGNYILGHNKTQQYIERELPYVKLTGIIIIP